VPVEALDNNEINSWSMHTITVLKDQSKSDMTCPKRSVAEPHNQLQCSNLLSVTTTSPQLSPPLFYTHTAISALLTWHGFIRYDIFTFWCHVTDDILNWPHATRKAQYWEKDCMIDSVCPHGSLHHPAWFTTSNSILFQSTTTY
jgi:hypothetical protein